MKKTICMLLILVMVLSLAACGKNRSQTSGINNPKIVQFVNKQGDDMLETLEYSFAQSSGMTCSSTIRAVGNGIVIDLNINELDNLDGMQKAQVQANYDAMDFSPMLTEAQQELPELEYISIYVREVDGDMIACIRVD